MTAYSLALPRSSIESLLLLLVVVMKYMVLDRVQGHHVIVELKGGLCYRRRGG